MIWTAVSDCSYIGGGNLTSLGKSLDQFAPMKMIVLLGNKSKANLKLENKANKSSKGADKTAYTQKFSS